MMVVRQQQLFKMIIYWKKNVNKQQKKRTKHHRPDGGGAGALYAYCCACITVAFNANGGNAPVTPSKASTTSIVNRKIALPSQIVSIVRGRLRCVRL